MFPAYSSSKAETSNKLPDWLHNSSFSTEQAHNVHHFQQNKGNVEKYGDDKNIEQTLEKYLSDDSESIVSHSSNEVINTHDKVDVPMPISPGGNSEKYFTSDSNDTINDSKNFRAAEKRSGQRQKKRKHSKSRERKHEHHPSKKKKKHKKDDYSNDSESDSDRKHRKKKKKDKKKKSKKHKKEGQEGKDVQRYMGKYATERYKDFPPVVPGKIFLEDLGSHKDAASFRTDRKKDDNNLAYGSIYREHIARRHLLVDCCVGEYKDRRIWIKDKKASESKQRYFDKASRAQSKQAGKKCSASEMAKLGEYVQVKAENTSTSEKQSEGAFKVNVNPLGIYDSVTELYLQGKGEENAEAASSQNISEAENVQEDEVQTKMAHYNKILNEEPNNIDLWLEFIGFQDEVLTAGKTERSVSDVTSNKPHRSSVLDIKMAVIQRALEKNPNCIKLKLFQLEMAHDIWDSDEILKEWNTLLFNHANSGPLWLKYLEFRESWPTGITISGLLKAYAKAIKTLSSVVNGDLKSHPALPQTVYYLLEIINHALAMLLQAGHLEKAIASYQAAVEFNLFMPEVLQNASIEDQQELFDAFWESLTPRIGEDGAQGWGNWVEKKGEVEVVKPWNDKEKEEKTEEEILQKCDNTHNAWLAMEHSRNQRHWLPWRPKSQLGETEEDCEDPDRQVLSDAVTSCLVNLKTEECKFVLVCNFLDLLGVEYKDFSDKNVLTVHWSDNIFLKSHCEGINLLSKTENKFVKSSENLETFVCNVFEQVIPKFSSKYKVVLYMMFMKYKLQKCLESGATKSAVKLLRKWAKSLLKEEDNRNCMPLWEVYANLEKKLGNTEESFKVFSVTIASWKGPIMNVKDIEMQTHLCSLYRSFVELQLGIAPIGNVNCKRTSSIGNKDSAIQVLYNMTTDEPLVSDPSKFLSFSKTLKTKKVFGEFVDDILSKRKDKDLDNIDEQDFMLFRYYGSLLVHWTTCAAYFLYLTENLDTASELFLRVLNTIQPENKYHSQPEYLFSPGVQYCYRQYCDLYLSYLSLCKYHTDTTVAPLRTLRDPLSMALEDLPTNPTLLSLYVDLESHASISGRVRQYFRTVAPIEGAATTWLFAVLAELVRKKKLEEYEAQQEIYSSLKTSIVKETGVTHQLRAWFERAVSHPVARRSILIWRLYALFEVEQSHLQQAKAVWYRALQQCPGAKALYMDMAASCPEQLVEITDLMIERELRLRTPLEELQILQETDSKDGTVEGQNVDKSDVSSGPVDP